MWRLIISARETKSSIPVAGIADEVSFHAFSSDMKGSNPTIFKPKAAPELATLTPIAPKPNTPNVLPDNSKPAKCFLFFSISLLMLFSSPSKLFTKLNAGTMFLAAKSIPAIANSATAFELAPGALNTGIPRFVYSSTGILFTPAPARPTALSEAGIDCSCKLKERNIIASGFSISGPTL